MIAAIVVAAASVVPQQFPALPLTAALQRAVAISPDVSQARDRVAENAALLAAAKGAASPALQATYAQSPQAGATNNIVLQQLTTLGAQIVLGDYFTYGPAVRQAAFALTGAQFDLLDAQRAERLKVIAQYYQTLKFDAILAQRQQDLSGALADLRAAQVRYHAGDAPRLDVVRAQVALATAQTDLQSARVDLANAQEALAVETGEGAAVFSQTRPAGIAAPEPISPARAVDRALTQRSDLLSAQQDVGAEEAAVRAARRAVLPAVTLSAGYTTGVDTGIPVHGPSANVDVALPLSHSARDRADAERARLAQAQDKALAIRRQIIVEVSGAARTYGETVLAAQSATRARMAAQEELRATEIGYGSGASSSLDLADARRTYAQAAIAELSALYARAQAAASLIEEMGP